MTAAAPITVWLRIRLLTEVVITRRGASAGVHECLDYLPGSVLLGAAAARLYARPGFGPDFFLSGRVRFGDGLPDDGQQRPAWPAPLSYHVEKGLSAERDPIFNLSADSLPPHQVTQVRDRHLMADGKRALMSKRYQLKSAINREEFGCAKESQLFGYDALPTGQVFLAPVNFADDVSETVRALTVGTLTGGGVRLGRSRSAQYGRVEISALAADRAPHWPEPSAGLPDRLLLYLASDLALVSERGTPTLLPRPEHFGLPAGTVWLDERSFLRTRSYSPWNAFRNARDAERQVLARGSVLAFARPDAATVATLTARLRDASVGLHTQEGLGRVLVDPEFVTLKTKGAVVPLGKAATPSPITKSSVVPVSFAGSSLVACLRRRATDRDLADRAEKAIPNWVNECWRYKKAGHFPSIAQWNEVRNIAVSRADWLEEMERHFHLGNADDGPRRAAVWNRPSEHIGGPPLGQALVEECKLLKDRALARVVLRETVVRVVRRMQKEKPGRK